MERLLNEKLMTALEVEKMNCQKNALNSLFQLLCLLLYMLLSKMDHQKEHQDHHMCAKIISISEPFDQKPFLNISEKYQELLHDVWDLFPLLEQIASIADSQLYFFHSQFVCFVALIDAHQFQFVQKIQIYTDNRFRNCWFYESVQFEDIQKFDPLPFESPLDTEEQHQENMFVPYKRKDIEACQDEKKLQEQTRDESPGI